MLLHLTCMLAVAAAAPHYDQRQEGDFNVRADVQNVVLLILRPEKLSSSFVDFFSKSAKRPSPHNEELQERAGIHAMEAFVEPNEPYKVEIGSEGERYPEADDGREVEVVIAGRRRLDTEPQAEAKDEYKLIGSTEQCGPGRERDPATLMCRFPVEVTTELAEADPPSLAN